MLEFFLWENDSLLPHFIYYNCLLLNLLPTKMDIDNLNLPSWRDDDLSDDDEGEQARISGSF